MIPATPRDLALSALNRADRGSVFPQEFLEEAFREHPDWSRRDRAFTLHLVHGVLRWRLRLDWTIEQAAHFSFEKIEPLVLNVLRIALYQIFFLDRVPESAAVKEAVTQAKRTGRAHLASFVNGILRRICREKPQFRLPDRHEDPVRHLSVSHSYPAWIVEKWIRELGIAAAEDLLRAGNAIPDPVLRANSLKTGRPGLLSDLEREGLDAEPTRFSPDGIRVKAPGRPVTDLDSFRAGMFLVQGEAAQICSHILAPRPGELVLDVCAGIGGKTTHMAALMEDRGGIVALDISRARLISLCRSAGRLGISSVRAVAADASGPMDRMFRACFDRILLDGPCSGLGVLSRHPDGKWSKRPEDIGRLSDLQVRLIGSAVPLLAENGLLLYTTCTISKEENEDVAARALRLHPGIRLETLRGRIPGWGESLVDGSGCFRTFPHLHGMDGFYGALFRKARR